jgi:predicted phosphodiesterase
MPIKRKLTTKRLCFFSEDIIEKNSVKALYTHGHLYGVNQTRMRLAEKAQYYYAIVKYYQDL